VIIYEAKHIRLGHGLGPFMVGFGLGLTYTCSNCRAMLCKRGLCRHAVSVPPFVCLSVRHVREFCQNE